MERNNTLAEPERAAVGNYQDAAAELDAATAAFRDALTAFLTDMPAGLAEELDHPARFRAWLAGQVQAAGIEATVWPYLRRPMADIAQDVAEGISLDYLEHQDRGARRRGA